MATERGGDPTAPELAGHGPPDLDLAAPGDEAVLEDRPSHTLLCAEGQRGPEAMSCPVRRLPRGRRLALRTGERTLHSGRAQPPSNLRVAQDLEQSVPVIAGHGPDFEHASKLPMRRCKPW